MKIKIQRNETSQPLIYENVDNTYTKGNLFCVTFKDGEDRVVHKYPLCSIFRIEEEYYNQNTKPKSTLND